MTLACQHFESISKLYHCHQITSTGKRANILTSSQSSQKTFIPHQFHLSPLFHQQFSAKQAESMASFFIYFFYCCCREKHANLRHFHIRHRGGSSVPTENNQGGSSRNCSSAKIIKLYIRTTWKILYIFHSPTEPRKILITFKTLAEVLSRKC